MVGGASALHLADNSPQNVDVSMLATMVGSVESNCAAETCLTTECQNDFLLHPSVSAETAAAPNQVTPFNCVRAVLRYPDPRPPNVHF